MQAEAQHYTFGEGELPAERLRWLAQTYAPATRSLLERLSLGSLSVVADLGCGPGYTTRLLHQVLRPELTLGLDNAPSHLELAEHEPVAGIRFLQHDVTVSPLPVPRQCLLFCRFLLAHLNEPVKVLRAWAEAVGRGGQLVVQETSELWTRVPAFERYYAYVEAMQAHYGQTLYIGRKLELLAKRAGWHVEQLRHTRLKLGVGVMARLHAMNLRTWRRDPFAVERWTQQELDQLQAELEALSHENTSGMVTSVLAEGQFVLR
jgi:SAM-dependent methyltransferase